MHHGALKTNLSSSERARHARACEHEKAIEWSQTAFKHAKAIFAHQQTVEHAQVLLQHSQDTENVKTAVIAALKDLGQFENLRAFLETDSSEIGVLNYAYALEVLGQTEQAFALIQTALLTTTEPLRTRFGLSFVRLLVARNELKLAQTILETLTPSDDYDAAIMLYEKYRLKYYRGDLKDLYETLETAIVAARKCDSKRLILLLLQKMPESLVMGLTEESQNAQREAIQLAEDIGSLAYASSVQQQIGYSLIKVGKFKEAQAPMARALRMSQSLTAQNMLANAYINSSEPEYAGDNFKLARDLMQQGLEIYHQIGHQGMVGNTLLFQAWAESMLGHEEVARDFFASEFAQKPEDFQRWHEMVSQIFYHLGEFQKTRAALQAAPLETYRADSLAAHHGTLGALALIDNNLQTALEEVNLALGYGQEINHVGVQAKLQLMRSIIYLRLQQTTTAHNQAHVAFETIELNQAIAYIRPLERFFASDIAALRQNVNQPIATTPAISTSSFLRTLGSFSLERDGQIIPWKASKTRELLAILLVAYLREDKFSIGKEELTDMLWEDGGEDSKFRVTLKRLRDQLGDATTIRSQNGVYQITHLKADVTEFLSALEKLDFDAALGWYKGAFLPGIDVLDIDTIRVQLWLRFRDTTLQFCLEQPALLAANLLEKLHALEPLDVMILERLLESLRLLNDPNRFERVYQKASLTFKREVGELPAELSLARV